MSEAHSGLKKAIGTMFQGASWQRGRVHFIRNVLSVVPKGSQDVVASIVRTALAQRDAQYDLLAFAAFPQRHWRQIGSTNAMERINAEVKRHTDVVDVFSNPAALSRLAGSFLIAQHDEWEVSDRGYFSKSPSSN
jgi:transposase-like protein